MTRAASPRILTAEVYFQFLVREFESGCGQSSTMTDPSPIKENTPHLRLRDGYVPECPTQVQFCASRN